MGDERPISMRFDDAVRGWPDDARAHMRAGAKIMLEILASAEESWSYWPSKTPEGRSRHRDEADRLRFISEAL